MPVKRARFFARFAFESFEIGFLKIKQIQILFQARALFALGNSATRFMLVKRTWFFARFALEAFEIGFLKIKQIQILF
jgi:hypothetical protein